jgi:hypothetical protein
MRGPVSIDRTPEGERRLHGLLSCVGLLCGLTVSNTVFAATEARSNDPVELAWVRLEGAESCPPRAAFVSALEKRVHSSQFVAKAERVLTVSLSNEKGPFRAVLSLKSKTLEEVESKQELFSYSSSCDEVFSATVLSVALLLNPDEFNGSTNDPALIEEPDNGFFDPPPEPPAGAPVAPPTTPVAPEPPAKAYYEIPVAPRPWGRSYAFIGASALAAIEQLPTAGPGFAARIELPLARAWLLWLQGDWLQAQPVPPKGGIGRTSGVTVVQDAGWLGASWLPYNNDAFEFQIGGGAGFRRLQFTLTDDDPRFQFALQLGIGTVFFLLPNLALQAQAAAVVPMRQERVGQDTAHPSPSWTQPPVGGQLQLGFLLGIPGPLR